MQIELILSPPSTGLKTPPPQSRKSSPSHHQEDGDKIQYYNRYGQPIPLSMISPDTLSSPKPGTTTEGIDLNESKEVMNADTDDTEQVMTLQIRIEIQMMHRVNDIKHDDQWRDTISLQMERGNNG